MSRSAVFLVLAIVLAMACGPAPRSQTSSSGAEPAPAALSGPKSLTLAVSEDPGNIWDAVTGGGGSGVRELGHAVHQFPATTAADGTPVARLIAELPAVDRGTWSVLPDGGMETTLKLRPGVRWHDGQPLTAQDLVFSWQVNRDQEVPNSNQAIIRLVSRAEAPDPTTLVLTWSELYPFADRLGHREIFPLPKHLLEKTYVEAKETLLAQPYFNQEYVGLGPYRIARWERGSHLELQAFDGYFLGKPKIEAIRVSFINDPNTMLANLFARSIQTILPPGQPDLEAMRLVKSDWEGSGFGQVLIEVPRWKLIEPQKMRNPQPADLADARARQALLLAINRPELATATYEEYGVVADSWVHPSFRHYAQVQEGITRYPYDPRRAAAILGELGWRRGADGVLEKGAGQRFTLTMRTRDDQKEALIIADNWKEIGIIGTYENQSPNELRDRAARANYTGVDISRSSMPPYTAIRSLHSDAIPTPENRWAGSNRGAYANPAWDELGRRFLSTLEDSKRVEIERELVRVLTTDLPLLPLMYDPDAIAVGGGLTGLLAATGTAHNGQIMHTFNIHEWDIK